MRVVARVCIRVEANVVQLVDVRHVENGEALLELLGKLLHVLFVAQRKHHSVNLVVFASC